MDANDRVLIAGGAFGLVDMKAIPKDWNLNENILVIDWVELFSDSQVFIVTIYIKR